MAGYQEQLDRTRRYYDRFKRLNDGMQHTAPSDSYIDDVYAFFQNCYHLKDWLRNDSAYTSHTDAQIEDCISNTPALAICADICNGTKHLTLNRRTRSGDEPKFGRKVISVDVTDSLAGDEVPTMIKIQIEVEHAGNKLDAFQLATDALRAWESFIK
jgi:hypothetical protein